jgi:hypothetical protein
MIARPSQMRFIGFTGANLLAIPPDVIARFPAYTSDSSKIHDALDALLAACASKYPDAGFDLASH